MDIGEFQDRCMATAQYPGRGQVEGLTYAAFGLANESGEVLGKLKKLMRDDERGLRAVYRDTEVRDAVAGEVADVLWYCMAVLDELDCEADEVALQLTKKLADRAERGVIQGSGDQR